jgi:hypothetical protein
MRRLLVIAVPSASLLTLSMACTSLTAPPSPEPITVDTAQVASARPSRPAPVLSANLPPGAASMIAQLRAAPAGSAQPEGKLQIQDLTVGKGKEAKTGEKVSVHYVVTLLDGKQFDSSRSRNKPFEFQLGQGNVIKGWDQGVVGMKVGGKRKLTIPPSLGYGERGMPPVIPPSSTLVFEVELLDVK